MFSLYVDRLTISPTAMGECGLLKLALPSLSLGLSESELLGILAIAILMSGARHPPQPLSSLSCSLRLEPLLLYPFLLFPLLLSDAKEDDLPDSAHSSHRFPLPPRSFTTSVDRTFTLGQ